MPLKIGVHVNNPALFLLSHLELAEVALATVGEEVQWHRYAGGTQTGALLVDGTFDVGGTGATPPIVDQAAGRDIAYVARSAPRPNHGTLYVQPDGPVRTVEDLRGRRVALGVGSWQTLLLAVALDRAGVAFSEVEIVNAGPESLEELARGELGAWIGQGSELVEAQARGAVRELVAAESLIANPSVWYARRDVAQTRGEALGALAGAIEEVGVWATENPRAAAALFADESGGRVEAWETFVRSIPWRAFAIEDTFVAEQQAGADVLARVGYLPRPVTIADAVVPALAPHVEAGLAAGRARRGAAAVA